MNVRRYKQSILVSRQSTKEYQNINFAQWSVDNVDHNIATLIRHGTFHGIGIIETVTPGEIKLNPIKRLRDKKLINEVINNCGKVPIVQYTPGLNNNTGYKFTSYRMLAQLNTRLKYSALNLIWHIGSLLNSTDAVNPN